MLEEPLSIVVKIILPLAAEVLAGQAMQTQQIYKVALAVLVFRQTLQDLLFSVLAVVAVVSILY